MRRPSADVGVTNTCSWISPTPSPIEVAILCWIGVTLGRASYLNRPSNSIGVNRSLFLRFILILGNRELRISDDMLEFMIQWYRGVSRALG